MLDEQQLLRKEMLALERQGDIREALAEAEWMVEFVMTGETIRDEEPDQVAA